MNTTPQIYLPTAPILGYSESASVGSDTGRITYHYEKTSDMETKGFSFADSAFTGFIGGINTHKHQVFYSYEDADPYKDAIDSTFNRILNDLVDNHSSARLRIIDQQLELLSEIKEGQDSQGFKAPSIATLRNVREIMRHLLEKVDSEKCLWIDPFIYSDEFSYVSMEWHRENRALHFDIKEDDMQYTRIWGTKDNVESEISDINTHNCLSLWKWLINEK